MTAILKAIDVITPQLLAAEGTPQRCVAHDTPLADVLPMLLDAPGRTLGVTRGGEMLGVVTETSLLEGLGRLIAPRDDSSTLWVECQPEEYSASRLAHAVEDADAHLVDLWTAPTDRGTVMATLRVRHTDPSAACHHLERYGFDVLGASGRDFSDYDLADERLRGLQALLNV